MILQFVELLVSFGVDALCELLVETEVGIELRTDIDWMYRCGWEKAILSVVSVDEGIWQPLYHENLFGDMIFRSTDITNDTILSPNQKQNLLSQALLMVLVPAGEFMMGALPDDKTV